MDLIEAKNLEKSFIINRNILSNNIETIKAVDCINFSIKEGETLGLVGESGSGKSTTGKILMNLLDQTSGEVLFQGENINKLDSREKRKIRKNMQIVFQNPYSSLDPKMNIYNILSQGLIIHNIVGPDEIKAEVGRLLEIVGLEREDMYKLPHEFSGGQRQRIVIARAISTRPKFIVLDEPVSALDVSVQSQILNLLKELQETEKISYLFIAHGLNVIRYLSHRVAVMYLGKIVEIGDVDIIFDRPNHPYTKSLISSILIPGVEVERNIEVYGEIDKAESFNMGCNYYSRCNYKMPICMEKKPELIEFNSRLISCHRYK